MKTSTLFSLLAGLVLAVSQARAAEADPATLVLAEVVGSSSASHLTEAYLTLTDVEKEFKNSDSAEVYNIHLKIQASMLNLQIKNFEKLSTAFPDDKGLQYFAGKLKETAVAILAQNEAAQAYLTSTTKDLEAVHKKHAASKALLLPLLKITNENAIP